ncbi:jacalin-related lectin 19 isoform X2 [Nicotiana tomentosiformis]|uniref:jacalin-related lectin 19 isoform X2 n=1 Tax=Nicotiana tomentosiformis TaxID=4098 RepID=UPI0008783018|nr:jacalin-related lectin 19 isoform X2 [Nicotiana tomentosiformis]
MDMRPVGKEQAGELKKRIVVGPWGGHGGSPWDDGGFTGVREITLVYSLCIDSMTVVYDQNGKPYKAEKHGGVGGSKTAQIKLQFPGEYLTGVSGYYCPVVYGGSPVIRSLTFSSNRRTFGPFGVEEGTRFSLPMEGGQIVGFKGRSGWYLDAICCYIAKIKTTTVLQMAQQSLKKLASSVSLNYKGGDDQSKFYYYKGGDENQTKYSKK